MSHILGFAIEILVAALLGVTIAYCIQLNRRLTKLRLDEAAMKTSVAELIAATASAERAIASLKLTVRESDETLGERLRGAEHFNSELAAQVQNGQLILDRLMKVVTAGRDHNLLQNEVSAKAPDAKAVFAAAQAFAERSRRRPNGMAA